MAIQALVGIIMGSQSDWRTMKHAADVLDELRVPYEARIVSAHRTPQRLVEYATTARKRGRVFNARWHMAWSRAYVSRKYGLPDPARGTLAVNLPKAVLSALALQRSLVERYGGSAAGALAWMRGDSALKREGLE